VTRRVKFSVWIPAYLASFLLDTRIFFDRGTRAFIPLLIADVSFSVSHSPLMFRTSDLPRSLAVHLPWVLSLHHRRPPPLGLRGLDSVLYGCGDVAPKNSTKAARHPRFSRSMAAMAVCFPRITSVAGHIFIISKLYCRLLSIVWYRLFLSSSVYINPLVKTRATHARMLARLGLDLMCAIIIVQIWYWSIHGR
jgi:hypothetical protein